MSWRNSAVLLALVSDLLAAFLLRLPLLEPGVDLRPRFRTADVDCGNHPHILNGKSEARQLEKGTGDL
jgi:hypothetical protein